MRHESFRTRSKFLITRERAKPRFRAKIGDFRANPAREPTGTGAGLTQKGSAFVLLWVCEDSRTSINPFFLCSRGPAKIEGNQERKNQNHVCCPRCPMGMLLGLVLIFPSDMAPVGPRLDKVRARPHAPACTPGCFGCGNLNSKSPAL